MGVNLVTLNTHGADDRRQGSAEYRMGGRIEMDTVDLARCNQCAGVE
jgi:hypothetical protein